MQRARVKDLLARMDEQEEMMMRWEGILVGLGEQMGKLGDKMDSLMGSQGVSAPPPPQEVVSAPPPPQQQQAAPLEDFPLQDQSALWGQALTWGVGEAPIGGLVLPMGDQDPFLPTLEAGEDGALGEGGVGGFGTWEGGLSQAGGAGSGF